MCTVSPGGDGTHESRSNVPHEQQVRVGREGVHASPGAETWRPRHPRKPRQTAQPHEGTWLNLATVSRATTAHNCVKT